MQVAHVDLLARTPTPVVWIVQSDRRTPSGRQLGPTKTRRSRRTVTLPPQVVVGVLVPLVTRPPDARLFTTRRPSITTTADRYGHLLPDQERQAAEAAARAVASRRVNGLIRLTCRPFRLVHVQAPVRPGRRHRAGTTPLP